MILSILYKLYTIFLPLSNPSKYSTTKEFYNCHFRPFLTKFLKYIEFNSLKKLMQNIYLIQILNIWQFNFLSQQPAIVPEDESNHTILKVPQNKSFSGWRYSGKGYYINIFYFILWMFTQR